MKKILIIEDDNDLQQLYREELTAEGYEVFNAHVGQQGLNMAKFHKPDLILLDIMLPGGLNGFDVLNQLRREPGIEKVPVIVLTNLDGEEKTARAIGISDYIVKANTSITEVIGKVKKCLT